MIALVSPAKTMRIQSSAVGQIELPVFTEQSQRIIDVLQKMKMEELQRFMKVNEKITKATYDNLRTIQFDDQGSRALYTYDGIQYKSMVAHEFSEEDQKFANQHIRILSGLYGVLTPNTSIYPYRLEMQMRLQVSGHRNLYEYWKEPMAAYFTQLEQQNSMWNASTKEDHAAQTYINLASKEYSRVIEDYMKQKDYITCTFKVTKNGAFKVESTASKKARGAMVQYMVKHRLQKADQLKQFDVDGYHYDDKLSTEYEYVFIKE